jgi:PAS domain S-box-containing protein
MKKNPVVQPDAEPERSQSKGEFQALENGYRELIEHAPDGIVLVSAEGKFKYASPSVGRLFGYFPEDLPDLDPAGLTHPDERERVIGTLFQLMQDPSQVPTLQYRFLHKNGQWRWIESTFSNLLARPGVEAIVINFHDIHDQKLALELLEKSQASLELAQSIAHLGSFDLDLATWNATWSKETYHLFGMDPSAEVPPFDQFLEMVHPEDRQQLRTNQQQAIESSDLRTFEFRTSPARGELRHLKVSLQPEMDAQGKCVHLLGTLLDITEPRQAFEWLQESEAKYRLLVDTSREGIWTIDREHRITYVNQAMADLLGYAPSEMLGKEFEAFLFAEDLPSHQERMQHRHAGLDEIYERRLQRRDGPAVWTVVSARALKDEQGNFNGSFSMFTDITARKQAEQRVSESEARLDGFLDAAPDAMVIVNQDGEIILANTRTEKMFGYTQQELLGSHVERLMPERLRGGHPGRRASFLTRFGHITAGIEREIFGRCKDGTEFPAEISLSPHRSGDEVVILAAVRDITRRKQVEESLRKNEQLLEEAQEIARIQSFTADLATGSLEIGPGEDKILGWAPGTYPLRAMLDMVHPADRERVGATMQRSAILQGMDIEYRILRDGELRWAHVKGRVVPEKNGKPISLLGVAQDITARKQNEEIMQAQRDLARIINTVTSSQEAWARCLEVGLRVSGMDCGGIYLLDENQRWLQLVYHQGLSDAFVQNTIGFPIDSPNGQTVLSGQMVYRSAGQISTVKQYQDEGLFSIAVIPIHHQGKALGCLNIASHTLTEVPGFARQALETIASEIGSVVVYYRTQAALLESEAKYRSLVDSQDAAISMIDAEGVIHYMNPIGTAPFGEPDQVVGKNLRDLFPQTADWQMEGIRQVIASGQGRVAEYQVQLPLGAPLWRHVSIQPIQDAEGRVRLAMVNSVDITERKVAEEALRRSEALLAEAQRLGRIGHIEWIASMKGLVCSDELYDILELPRDGTLITQGTFRSMTTAEDRERMNRLDHEAFARRSDIAYEYRVNLPSGKQIWLYHQSRVTYGENGKPVRMLGTIQDITDRKQAEAALLQSERDLQNFLDSSPDTIYVLDLVNHTSQFLNREEFLGYSRAELNSSSSIMTSVHPDDLPLVAGSWKQVLAAAQDQVLPVEYRIRNKAGSWEWVQQRTTVLARAEDGRPQKLLVTLSVVTERKQTEAALQQSEKRYRSLHESMIDGFVEVTMDGQIIDCNDIYCQMLGYSKTELFTKNYTDLTPEKWHAYEAQVVNEQIMKLGHSGIYEKEYRRSDGSLFSVELNTVLLYDEQGQPASMWANARDITERKQAEAALRASEEKYRGLMESLDSAVALIDYSGRFLYMNDTAAGQMGSTVQHMTGKAMVDLFPAPLADRQLGSVRAVIDADKGQTFEAITVIQGEPRWYRTSIQPIHDETGQAVAVVLNSTDIHALKTIQQELEELNRTLEERVRQRTVEVQDLYEHAPAGYHSLDARGNIILINQTELDWLGYTREEVLGRPISEFYTPAGKQVFAERFAQLLRDGSVRDLDFEFIRKDGSTFPALINAIGLFDEVGNFVISRSTVFDNTERKRAEQALRESEEQNRLLFEESPVAVILLDGKGQISRLNRSYEQLTGFTQDQLIGTNPMDLGLVSPMVYEHLKQSMRQLGDNQGKTVPVEHSLMRADGVQMEVESRFFLVNLNGARQVLVTSSDISAYKKAEELLRMANAEMEHAMRMKDDFLANMSHELRTPLTGILTITESMLEQVGGPLTERQERYLGNIESSGRHLLSLINDVLDLSKVEAGKVKLQAERVLASEICQSSLNFVKEPALKKHIQIESHCEPAQFALVADTRRLKQVLVNLLSNAVKFTPAYGRVSLSAQADAQQGMVHFVVEDTGIGISSQDLARLFSPFTQVDTSLTRQYDGTGLGLALVKKLAELHDGSVRVESEVGKGSRFIVSIPWRQAVSAEGPADPGLSVTPVLPLAPEAKARKRILLAEDNDVSAMTTQDYLDFSGYDVARAVDGGAVLALAQQFRPDLILMDIQMPFLDGIELTRRLRQMPEFRNTPIIAVTALAMAGDRERVLAAGVNEYMSKPFRLSELANKVSLLLEKDR